MTASVDPRLTKAIKDARKGANVAGTTVQATVKLRSPDPAKVMSPAQTTRSVRQIIDKVTKRVQRKPRDLLIYGNLESFSISADAELVDRILSEDNVEAASYDGPSI